MKAKCLDVVFRKGSFSLHNGVKKDAEDGYYEDGSYFRNRGFGIGSISNAAELEVKVRVNGEVFPISVVEFFREKFKIAGNKYAQLTNARIRKIKDARPDHLNVSATGSPTKPYEIDRADLESWFKRI